MQQSEPLEQNEDLDWQAEKPHPFLIRVLTILWPSFFMAGCGTALFFVFAHPSQLGNTSASEGHLGVYSIVFLLLWAVGALSAAAVLHLSNSSPGGN